jgi:hypothetical protein
MSFEKKSEKLVGRNLFCRTVQEYWDMVCTVEHAYAMFILQKNVRPHLSTKPQKNVGKECSDISHNYINGNV